jgi:REP element-mobilizing transposase RayT
MTRARKAKVSLAETPYYHCVARCVRRAWLCGQDEYTGKDYSHRKDWVLDRLRASTQTFAIEVCAFAVMSNHFHVVLFVDIKRAQEWTEQQVIKRWTSMYALPTLVERYRSGEAKSLAEKDAARNIIEEWRDRLIDVSWFLRSVKEPLARQANAEDGCTGRFWEGRFKSQALLDNAGVLLAMAYVDLNPVRAGIAATPEASSYTSVQERIRTRKGNSSELRLRSFQGKGIKSALPCTEDEYLKLLDWTGRLVRNDKRGSINKDTPPILTRLKIDTAAWQEAMQPHGNVFGRAVGQLDTMRLHAKALGQSWVRGVRQAERLGLRE